MKKTAKIGVLAVVVLAFVSVVVSASGDAIVIENPPKMAVGDTLFAFHDPDNEISPQV